MKKKDLMKTESVWNYPRPPRLESVSNRIRVLAEGLLVADTCAASRLLETSHPPTYYLPLESIKTDWLRPNPQRTFCEFKGVAHYWDLALPGQSLRIAVAWSYPEPSPGYEGLREHLAFYASRVDECWVDEEQVQAQEGDFYGGWRTANLTGPFKGGAGTRGW
jgi:uncharacterized protein (DUF427 family)